MIKTKLVQCTWQRLVSDKFQKGEIIKSIKKISLIDQLERVVEGSSLAGSHVILSPKCASDKWSKTKCINSAVKSAYQVPSFGTFNKWWHKQTSSKYSTKKLLLFWNWISKRSEGRFPQDTISVYTLRSENNSDVQLLPSRKQWQKKSM